MHTKVEGQWVREVPVANVFPAKLQTTSLLRPDSGGKQQRESGEGGFIFIIRRIKWIHWQYWCLRRSFIHPGKIIGHVDRFKTSQKMVNHTKIMIKKHMFGIFVLISTQNQPRLQDANRRNVSRRTLAGESMVQTCKRHWPRRFEVKLSPPQSLLGTTNLVLLAANAMHH